MKSIACVQRECGSSVNVYTVEHFARLVECGGINEYDGNGYFHDGESVTNMSVWDSSVTYDDIKGCPYICWSNR